MTDILIIKPSSLGDIVHGLVAAQSIREQMPSARISWVVRDIFSPLVDLCETVNGDVILFHRGQGLAAFGRLLGEIGRHEYDAALDMQGLMRSGWMIWAAKAKRKIGRSDAREGAGFFYREAVRLPQNGHHAIDILLQFLPPLGLEAKPGGPLRFPSLAQADKADVLLCPESRRAEKVWPHFLELAETLTSAGVSVSWIGQDPKNLPPGITNLTHKPSIESLIANISAATVIVANDSGPMHLAAAMGRKVVALFGPTDPASFGPYPPNASRYAVLTAPDACLGNLTVDTVSTCIHSALEQSP